MNEVFLTKYPTQKNKVAIVTGANIGIGFETAKALAYKGIKVILACRNEQKAKVAQQKITTAIETAEVEFMPLDLSEEKSVECFTDLFTQKYKHLDILVNNAGIMSNEYNTNSKGYESQLATNFLGHFLLVQKLFPVLKNTKDARIVHLSSIAHKKANIYFDDMQGKKKFKGFKYYGQSKLACLLFAKELQRRIEKEGLSVKSIGAHPGVSITNISQNLPKIVLYAQGKIGSLFMSSSVEGAEAVVHAALSENVQGGEYFGPKGLLEFKGKVGNAYESKKAQDEVLAKKLWEKTEELLGLEFHVL